MMTLIVRPDGQVTCLYEEAIDLAALGPVTITRAASVEPDGRGRWWVDLSPAGGPAALGPFALRSQAIAAERDWLAAHLESADRPFLGASKAGPD